MENSGKSTGCSHGRPPGQPCPHCLGINAPQDAQGGRQPPPPTENYASRPMESREDWALRQADGKLLSDLSDEVLQLLKRRLSRDLKRSRTWAQITFFEEYIARIRSEIRGRMVANALDASSRRTLSDVEFHTAKPAEP